MKLWLISQTVNNDYDTFDSAVVAAETSDEAQQMHPAGKDADMWEGEQRYKWDWCHPDDVKVELVGEAKPGTEKGVICASFNAG